MKTRNTLGDGQNARACVRTDFFGSTQVQTGGWGAVGRDTYPDKEGKGQTSAEVDRVNKFSQAEVEVMSTPFIVWAPNQRVSGRAFKGLSCT